MSRLLALGLLIATVGTLGGCASGQGEPATKAEENGFRNPSMTPPEGSGPKGPPAGATGAPATPGSTAPAPSGN